MGPESTPGPSGYLIAYAVSVAALPVVVLIGSSSPPEVWPAVWLVVVMYAAVLGLPFAVVGIPIVHLIRRRIRWQWVHVLMTGAVTLMLVGGLWLISGTPPAEALAWGGRVAVATMIGRLAAAPARVRDLPPRRRTVAADEDSAGAVRRW